MANELSRIMGTQVSIGKIDMGLLNRIIIDDLLLKDQSGKEMLKVTRLSVKFEILSLFKGKIAISSVQLFGFNINLNKKTPEAVPNFQFALDAFASKETSKPQKKVDLRINSILIRRGRLSYDILSEQETPGKFNAKHVKLQNITANISLKALQSDSINASIKRLSVDEQSGIELKKLSLKVVANDKRMHINNLSIDLPGTSIQMDTIRMTYNSLEAFAHFTRDVHFVFNTLPSYITLKDISPFVPALAHFKEKIDVEVSVNGTVSQLNCTKLEISSGDQFRLKGDLSLQDLSLPTDTYLFGNLSNLSANSKGIGFLVRNLSESYNGVPPLLERLGDVSFHGEISGYFNDLVTYGIFRTSIGSLQTDLKLSTDKADHSFSYSGGVKTKELALGKLLADEKLGNITFNLDVHGKHVDHQYPSIVLKGLIAAVDYSNYTYENITLDGEYKRGGFNGKAAINDPNGSILMNGAINMADKVPSFNFRAEVDNVRLHDLNLTEKYKDAEFSVRINADFTGGSIDEMIGEINVDSLSFTAPDKEFFMNNLKIAATREGRKSQLSLLSEYLKVNIEGNYLYRTLPQSVMNIVRRYVPSLILPDKKPTEAHNNFTFDVHVYNTDFLSTIFDIPFKVYSHSTIKGYVNDGTQRLRLEGYFPRLRYKNTYIESGMLLCENPSDQFRGRVRFSSLRKSGAVNVSLDMQAKDDELTTTIDWGNNGVVTYSGQLATTARFLRTQGDNQLLKTIVDIKQSDIMLNDSLWQVHPSQVVVDSGKVHVENFYISQNDRFIRIDGCVSSNPTDTIKADLKDLNIGYIFDIVNLKSVDFKGDASGKVYASGVLKVPVMNAHVSVKDLSFNDGLLGDAIINGSWDNEKEGIYLDANIQESGFPLSHVEGYIYPLIPKSGLDLNIEANSINIKFLEFYIKSIGTNIQGRGTGKTRLYGTFKELNIVGSALADASIKIGVLNTPFAVKDSIHLLTDGILFDNVYIADLEGHSGTMNGRLHYQNFKNMTYQLEFKANNMLVMNTRETGDMPFFGTVYATGSATLSGNEQALDVNANMTTNRNTNFTYINGGVASAASNQFIKFVDKTPRRPIQDSIPIISYFEEVQRDQEEKQELDIRLNISVDATPDATMKIIMDPLAGDYISGKGAGNIRTEFYNKGDIKMFGNYRISQGVYKFSLQQVIRKDFIIKDGSTISFNGAPLDATMNIQAVYAVNSASLNDLIPDASSISQQPNIRVNCIMNLSGVLLRPTIKLGLELPNERDEIQTLVRNYISTDEQMNMQILYLLAIGKFYMQDTNNTQNSQMMTSMLSSTLSGQLNNALSQIFDSNNWNIGTNLSTGERGWTDVEVEGILSGQLLNNRLIINGNFGYRDNPMANTNFVGDFEAEWLLTPSGDIRLKAYNETNDRYYTKTNLTTQGVGIMFRHSFDKWSELLFWNSWRLKRTHNKTLEAVQQNGSPATVGAQAQEKRDQ